MSSEFFCRTPTNNKSYDGHYSANMFNQKEAYLAKVRDLPNGAIYRQINDPLIEENHHQQHLYPITTTLEDPSCNRQYVPVLASASAEELQKKQKHKWNWNWLWLIIGLLLLGWFFWWLFNRNKDKTDKDKGKIVIGVDSRPNLNATTQQILRSLQNNNTGNNGNLTKAVATIDHIQALPNAPGKNWVPVSNTHQNVDLFNLKNSSPSTPTVIVDTSIPVGQYQKLKLHINKIMVDDSLGGKTVYTAGNNIEFDIPFKIENSSGNSNNSSGNGDKNKNYYSNKKDGGDSGRTTTAATTVIILDIPLDESLRNAVDENNRPVRVFAPVINYEARGDAQVSTANKKLVVQKPGVLLSQGKIGMDVNGNVDHDSMIPPNATLRVDKGKIFLVYPGPLPPLPPMPPVPVPTPTPMPGPVPTPLPVPSPSPSPNPMPMPMPLPGPMPLPTPNPNPNLNLNSNSISLPNNSIIPPPNNHNYLNNIMKNLTHNLPHEWVQPNLQTPNFANALTSISPAIIPGHGYNRGSGLALGLGGK